MLVHSAHPTPHQLACVHTPPPHIYMLLVENKICTLNKYSIPTRVNFFHSLMCNTKCYEKNKENTGPDE